MRILAGEIVEDCDGMDAREEYLGMVIGQVRLKGTILAAVFGGLTTTLSAAPGLVERLKVWVSPEVRAIDKELSSIEGELESLPVIAYANTGTRRGFHTGSTSRGDTTWVELRFREPSEADQIVLIPLLAKSAAGDQPGFGFPKRFQIEAETIYGEVFLVRDETSQDFPNPGLYPVVSEIPSDVKISRIRLSVIEPWVESNPPVLALSEVMVLSGNMNIAIGAEVTASSSRKMAPTWSAANLVDMVTPLGFPVRPAGKQLIGWQSEIARQRATEKSVVLDLGRTMTIEEIRMVPVWIDKMQAWPLYGYPLKFIAETAGNADFRNLLVIKEETPRALDPTGQSLQCYQAEGQRGRFVRVRATSLKGGSGGYVFALAELQVYSGGKNVALGAKVITEESQENEEWGRLALTDGLAGDGSLIELPEWFSDLDQRRGLEARRASLSERRVTLLAKVEQLIIGGSVGGAGGIGLLAMFLLWRGARQRKIDRELHRERLARDLHDELGSNLGSIALISSFAVDGDSNEDQMRNDLIEIEEVARESADSMRDMVELLGGGHGGASSDWLEVLENLATRLLRGVELDCRLPVGPMILEPDLETRREIYLFCKEVLHNISKHSGASNVRFHMKSEPKGLFVELADDGCGFDVDAVVGGYGLGNLRERAIRLRAVMKMNSSPEGSTVVTLEIPRGRRWRKPEANKNNERT